ncbi:Subtilisin-like serine protease, partial [Thalictrum thalictroides]
MAAFDDAIADGVDIISISIGTKSAHQYYEDPIAIGSFHAMQKGVLTSQSAGNSGPYESTVASIAPWKLSVAASTTDRQFIVKVVLGDNTTLVGKGISPFDMKGKKFPLISFYAVTNSFTGKIIFKNFYDTGGYELQMKAAGIISGSDEDIGFSSNYPLPGSILSSKDGERVNSYINNTRHPVAEILKTEAIRNGSAPVVGSFSSRGPNPFTKDILKPDIAAPGVDILAAWSPEGSPSFVSGDERSTKYNIVSGTSMACPHVTGAAAYVKTFHPDWSPAAIKSALMTT